MAAEGGLIVSRKRTTYPGTTRIDEPTVGNPYVGLFEKKNPRDSSEPGSEDQKEQSREIPKPEKPKPQKPELKTQKLCKKPSKVVHRARGKEIWPVSSPDNWLNVGQHALTVARGIVLHRIRFEPHHDPADGIFFAGPWIGEFGFELMHWQGGIRRLAYELGLYTIIMGDLGHDLLYEYADEYWSVPTFFRNQDHIRECDRILGEEKNVCALKAVLYLATRALSTVGKVKQAVVTRRFGPEEQDWCKLQPDSSPTGMQDPYCCLILRQRGWNAKKNWSPESWLVLSRWLEGEGMNVAFVSSLEELRVFAPQIHVHPCNALRRSVNLLCGAKFAISSESGGGFLSLLCGCPTLIFGSSWHKQHMTVDENPLKTPISYLEHPDYNFSAQEVIDAARAFMQDL